MPNAQTHSLSLTRPAVPARADVRSLDTFLLLAGLTVLGPIMGLELLLVLLLGLIIGLILIG